jgi:hypothetical protein
MLDYIQFLLETVANFLKHGWNPALAVMTLVGLLRIRAIRNKLHERFPWLKAGKSEVQCYVANQARIEAKIDALAAHMGVPPCGQYENGTSGVTNSKPSYRSLQAVTFPDNLLRRVKKMAKKFKSRKFILAVVTAVLIVLNDGLDLGIDSETVLAFAGIVAVWITGESVVDTARARKGNADEEPYSDTDHAV